MTRRLTVVMMVAWLLSGPLWAAAEEHHLLDGKAASTWSGMVKINEAVKLTGEGSFELYGKYPTELISSEMIPIDMGSTYTISAWMRSLEATLPASANMGLRMYTKEKRPITMQNVGAVYNSETALAEPAMKGTTELRIVGNPRWLEHRGNCVAFNVADDYADLPNYALSAPIKEVLDEGEHYTIRLATPLSSDYPNGVKVRLHSPYGAPLYGAADGWIPAEWTNFSRTLQGEARFGASGHQFWRGTAYVRPFVWFGNWNRIPEEGARLLVDKISFTSIPTPAVEILGNLTWPSEWRVFGPMREDDHVDDDVLTTLPDAIGVDGRSFAATTVQATGNRLDFEQIYGSFEKQRVAWIFGTIAALRDGKVTLGFGADWWMQVWVDGASICDTSTSGNVNWPPDMRDHLCTIDLARGEHVLAIRFKAGSGSAVLALGGPDQLRHQQEDAAP